MEHPLVNQDRGYMSFVCSLSFLYNFASAAWMLYKSTKVSFNPACAANSKWRSASLARFSGPRVSLNSQRSEKKAGVLTKRNFLVLQRHTPALFILGADQPSPNARSQQG